MENQELNGTGEVIVTTDSLMSVGENLLAIYANAGNSADLTPYAGQDEIGKQIAAGIRIAAEKLKRQGVLEEKDIRHTEVLQQTIMNVVDPNLETRLGPGRGHVDSHAAYLLRIMDYNKSKHTIVKGAPTLVKLGDRGESVSPKTLNNLGIQLGSCLEVARSLGGSGVWEENTEVQEILTTRDPRMGVMGELRKSLLKGGTQRQKLVILDTILGNLREK